MTTVLVSDLHLAIGRGTDLARRPELLARLVGALEGADRVVLLGDALELRERPLARVLELARPVLQAIGKACAGGRVTLVAGNHDHQLAEPWLARGRLDDRELPLDAEWTPDEGGELAERIAGWMPATEVTFAYPGLWLRPGVYATHGHYLDVHLTIPRLEAIAASLLDRVTARGRPPAAPSDYEAVLAPLYALLFGLAQAASPETLRRGGGLSRRVWESVNGRSPNRWMGFLLGRVTIPGAVAALNRAGLGPFGSELSGVELRRSGLRGMATVVERLGVQADHVIFGHTHRPGPLPEDDPAEWSAAGGVRLWNTGSWLNERALMDDQGRRSPYWPGTVMRVGDEGDPVLENALADAALPASSR